MLYYFYIVLYCLGQLLSMSRYLKPLRAIYCILIKSFNHRLRADLDGPKGAYLTGNLEEGSLNIITLLLTGRGTPYLHNGVVYVGDEDHYVRIMISVIS